MRRLAAGIAFALAMMMPGLARAESPKATVAPVPSVMPGDIVVVDASASTGDVFDWESLSGKQLIPSESGKRGYFACGTPGRYEFLFFAIGVADGKASLDKVLVTIVVDGPAPPAPPPTPPPGPPPGPTPDPTPTPLVTGHLYATYLADARAILPSHAAMKRPPAMLAGLGTLDTSWRWYQNNEAEPAALNLLSHATDFPTVIIQQADGRIVATLKAPSEADVLAAIKKLRGGK